jgi:hypothetical protein
MSPNIIFNGKAYDSVDEMPPDHRRAYESIMGVMADKNRNGMPDILEGLPAAGTQMASSMQIFFEGKMYSGLIDLPPEARARYDQAMGKLDRDKDGVIDFMQGAGTMTAVTGTGVPQTSPPPRSPSPAEGSPDRRLVVVGVVIGALLCTLAGLAAMLLLRWPGK